MEAVDAQPFGANPSGFLVYDPEDLRIRFASSGVEAVLGYSARELASRTVLDVAPDLSRRDLERVARALVAGHAETAEFEAHLRRKDGGTVVGLVRLQGMSDAERELLHATIQPEAKEGHGLSAALLRSVIDTAPDAIVTIDRDGRVDSFSPAAEQIFGYRAEEVIGRNVNMLMPEPYRSQHDRYLARYLTTGEKRIIGIGRTVIARHKSGRTFPIELAVGEVKIGATHLFTGFIRDISDRVAAQERVMKLQQELSHVSRLSAMGEIVSMIVHELNQPLTAIANFGEAAKRLVEGGGEKSRRAADFMEKSVRQAHRASDMIRRLRSFVSRGSTEMEPITVNDVIRDAARLALIGAADQNIHTRFELAEELPQVTADRVQVQQVVVNLIRNGIDAMLEAGPGAGEALLVVVSTGRDAEGNVLVSVADGGPGIAPEVAGDLFTPFVTTKTGGMGIGLSMSRSIVEAHGGRIWVEPAREGGARFVFTLPAGRGEAA
jgi:two-component system sensor kinase FixL